MTFSVCIQEEETLAGFDHKALHGLWWKDRHLTDFKSYEQQLDLLSLGGIQKKAALFFIRGIRVHANDEGWWALQKLCIKSELRDRIPEDLLVPCRTYRKHHTKPRHCDTMSSGSLLGAQIEVEHQRTIFV